MKKRSKAQWREVDFERWFKENPVLPSGERLLVIKDHDPISRVIDIAAIDAEAGLVVLEVKNENAHRTSIGQALEYLAHLEDVTLDDVEFDFADYGKGNLREEFERTFRAPLEALSPRRRVYLVAPAHDSYVAVCASYLSKRFEAHNVQFSLLTATEKKGGFSLTEPAYPERKRPGAMFERFGVSASGRLYLVLDSATPPVVWAIGKWRADGPALDVSERPSLTALRRYRHHLVPLETPPAHVDRSMGGTRWRYREKPVRNAVVIGSLRPGVGDNLGEPVVVFAQFKGDTFQTFRRRTEHELRREWIEVTDTPVRSWRNIATAATAERLRRRARSAARKGEALRSLARAVAPPAASRARVDP